MFNTANQITMFRMFVVPIIVLFMYIPGVFSDWIALFLFTIASLSDLIDGHIARKENIVTSFGKFLDPLADKILVTSVLIVLVDLGRVPAWVVILILCRELMVTGLRAVAASDGIVVAADRFGKLKTILQLIALGFLIVYREVWGFNIALIGMTILYLALIVTIFSGVNYFIGFYRRWNSEYSSGLNK
ncbi:CDP-diacylglycerol--glycerol-3-phosphate 3-phosphatidyltransferase [Desulfovibrio litoralis]|uniref:CDP-diacylglycerol--glycerol-3-phosphate 3-phosphatidyltransferase n=1 Tax=Desulfovibrio litoralis TaxID=466107 RepID=UPI000932D794|nr:CDP-diacylglycerol--glycerol-3-phosphate 3-phosphatidyltransferase [Desulfovibrio litoralis]